jgi:hypothetical protein
MRALLHARGDASAASLAAAASTVTCQSPPRPHPSPPATTQQSSTWCTFAASSSTYSSPFYLEPIILHHNATWRQVTPAIPFLSPPRVSSTPSAWAPSPHKGAGPDIVVSYIRYRQFSSIGAVGVARSWWGIIRCCIVTTIVAAGSIAPRHVIVPSHAIIRMQEVVATVWPRCWVRVRPTVWREKASFHSPRWHMHVRILHRDSMHVVPRRHGIVLERFKLVVFKSILGRPWLLSITCACIYTMHESRWVRVRPIHMFALFRDICVELLQISGIQSLWTKHIAEVVVICHVVHGTATLGTCGVESIKPTMAGVLVRATIAKCMATGKNDDGVDRMLYANGASELFCRQDSLLYIWWNIFFAQIDRSSIKPWSHAYRHDRRTGSVRLVHDT